MSMRSFGSALQDATNVFFKLRDQRLDRERQTKIDAQNQQMHDLQMKQLQLALEDRPRDLAWEQASRISSALGPEEAFNNNDYLDSLKRAGVSVPRSGTPGKYLMAAPDMADGSQGIGPDQVTADTGVVLPAKIQLARAQSQQQLEQAKAATDAMGMLRRLSSGQQKLDPNDPWQRYALSQLPGSSANELVGPADNDPNLTNFERKQRIIAKTQKEFDTTTTSQYATRLDAIRGDAETQAKARYPMPGEGNDVNSELEGVKYIGKPDLLANDRAVVQAKRDKFVEQYIKQQMKLSKLDDPYGPPPAAPAAPAPAPNGPASLTPPQQTAAPAAPNPLAALLQAAKGQQAPGAAPSPSPNKGQAAGQSRYTGGMIGSASEVNSSNPLAKFRPYR